MQDSRLYLIFEFLSMDLKKYLDSIPPGQFMDSSLVKVRVCRLLLILMHSECMAYPCFVGEWWKICKKIEVERVLFSSHTDEVISLYQTVLGSEK